jgi:ribosome-binding protein aMBF1 (putative translation factor)|uniref:Transcription regulator, probable n=1 Tax=uncultured bacterium contig00001 TaxID=1181493 RepID=A0A806K0P9_9BACT|nr:transcription regulator, probable [uncultured bacterium contig00001]
MNTKPVSPIGDDWDELRETLLTPEERSATDVKVALLGEIINARQSKGLTQKELGAMSGIKQPVIARLERGNTDPQLSTLIRVLAPLGKTLAIVPLGAND